MSVGGGVGARYEYSFFTVYKNIDLFTTVI